MYNWNKKWTSKSGWENSKLSDESDIVRGLPYISTHRWEISPISSYGVGKKDFNWNDQRLAVYRELFVYQKEKLVKNFLYQFLNKHKGTLNESDFEIVTETSKWFKKEVNYAVLKPYAITKIHDLLKNKDNELTNLFLYYKDVIAYTEIKLELPSKEEKEGEKGKSQEGSGEGEGEGEDELKYLRKALTAMLSNIEESFFKPGSYIGGANINGKHKVSFHKVAKPMKTEMQYDQTSKFYGDRLASLLDINFDPDVDKLNNIRTGHLDTRKLGEYLAGNNHVFYRTEEHQKFKPFKVCILGDESGSMHPQRIPTLMQFYMVIHRAFSQILPEEDLFIYGHTGMSTPIVRCYQDHLNPSFLKNIWSLKRAMEGDRVRYVNGNVDRPGHYFGCNYDGPVIEAIYKRLREITDSNILFVSLSDGQPAGYSGNYGGLVAIKEMKRILEKCRRDGFSTLGVGVDYAAVDHIYANSVSVSSGDLHKSIRDFSTAINNIVKSELAIE